MINENLLKVWNDRREVGSIWRDPLGRIGFRYDSKWRAGGGFAVSQTLPLLPADFDADKGIAHCFFANLLPEGGAREHIVRDLKIPNTDFDLLRAIGGECAGALSILPVGQQPEAKGHYHPISNKELANLVARRGQAYAGWPTRERPRLSLAGAQDKCPILLRHNDFFLPKGEAPSSHILKFELSDYRNVPAYETFTTLLAGAIQLPVVEIDLRSIEKIHYTIIGRFDRVRDNQGEVQRLHQEDFCQALGIGHEKKYQESGGPSFAECFRLLQNVSSDPAVDTQNLLRWQIFNVLAGNSDGHAKNLSLLRLPDGQIRLAPFYDLVCTRAIERIDDQLAFDVGGERNPNLITATHWATLADQCDIKPRFLNSLVKEAAVNLMQNLSPTKTVFETRFGAYPALQRIMQIVMKQCRRVT